MKRVFLITTVLIGIMLFCGYVSNNAYAGDAQVYGGWYHTLGLKTDGTVVAVGWNHFGQCDASSWTDIKQVSAGVWHTIGLKTDGTVVAVGRNSYGQCDVTSWTDIKRVSAGDSHTIGLKTDGTVVAVGRNSYGQCNVASWTDIKQVSAGVWHTTGLKTDGTVVAVGDNDNGQCKVMFWTDIKQIAVGDYHTIGLKTDGTVVAVGTNSFCQCDVSSWTDIKQVSAGYGHTIGLKTDGTVVAVGYNDYGQCDVSSWTDIKQVSAGDYYTIGLKTDGTVVAVGGNAYGQCDVSSWSLSDAQPSLIWYYDSDNDGYGDPSISINFDSQPYGYVTDNTDCDDTDSTIHPGAIEIAGDGIDQDCDGSDLQSSVVDLDNGLVAYYPFNGNANDESGVSNAMSIYNTEFKNNSLFLNGIYGIGTVDGYTAEAYISNFEYQSFTISHDFFSIDFNEVQEKINIITGGSSYRWFSLRYNNGKLELTLNNQTYTYLFNNSSLTENQWHNVICSFDLVNKKIVTFLDGQKLDDIILDNNFTLEAIVDGVSDKSFTFTNYSNANVFHGYVDNLRVYNKALNMSEIQQLYNSFIQSGTSTWYKDYDGDGYGDSNNSMDAGTQPNGYVTDNTDCDDTDSTIHPGATEIADDGIDQDCDGKDTSLSTAWYLDSDGDGYGDPAVSMDLDFQPVGYVADNTDCDDTDPTVHPDATEIVGDSIDQDCDGSDNLLSVEQIYLLSPIDNKTMGFGTTTGQISFSFSKILGASKYMLYLKMNDILNNFEFPISVDLIPPGTGNNSPWSATTSATTGFSESFLGMFYNLSLDQATWDAMSLYSIKWGVEAYNDSGVLIGSTYELSVPAKYGNDLKLLASSAIAMTSPTPGQELSKANSAPTFQWDTYQGVSTYTFILAHLGSFGFDTIIDKPSLTLNISPMDDLTWQSMPIGDWYWTVFGFDSFGSQMPSDFTIFDFEVKD